MVNEEIQSDEDSSVEAPPPPPPDHDEEEKFDKQLKVFQGMAEFSNQEEDDDKSIEDDGSVEVPPPPDYDRMGEPSRRAPIDPKKPLMFGGIGLCLLVVIAVVLGVGFGTGAFTESEKGSTTATNPAPVPAPAPNDPTNLATARPDRIRQYLASVAINGDDSFVDPASAEYQALVWLQEEDPLKLDPIEFENHLRLDQRYALLTVWFQSEFDWFDETNWLSEDECTWKGVTCEVVSPDFRRNLQDGSEVVVGLNLKSNNVQGRIPDDIKLLQFLLSLDLSKNQLTGDIPASIHKLEFLEEMYLDTNKLSGELQNVDFAFFTNMEILDLSDNELSGPIPDSFWSMNKLSKAVLDKNRLTGSLSNLIGNLQSLGELKNS
jgi:hypothetical protein